jgi:GTP-binding protein HflX
MNVLAEIGAADIPILEVYNKTDLIGSEPRIERDEAGQPVRVWLSARDDRGLDLFYQALSELLGNEICETSITLTAAQGRLRARLFSFDAVLDEEMNDDGSQRLKIRLPEADWQRLLAAESITEASLDSSRPVSMREEFC